MPYVSPLLALAEALYGRLAFDATLATLAPGGVHTDVPQNPVVPFVWIELRQDANYGAFGSQPGRRSKPGIHVRLHVFQSEHGTPRDAQVVVSRLTELLWDDALPLVADPWDVLRGKPLPTPFEMQAIDEELRGMKVKEFVLLCDYILEERAA